MYMYINVYKCIFYAEVGVARPEGLRPGGARGLVLRRPAGGRRQHAYNDDTTHNITTKTRSRTCNKPRQICATPQVTWANKPRIRHQKNKPHNPKKAAQTL